MIEQEQLTFNNFETFNKNDKYILKFPDEKGIVEIDGIGVRWKFANHEFANRASGKKPQNLACPHLEFVSIVNEKPHALSETGYKSHFFSACELDNYKNIRDYILDLILIQNDNKPMKIEFIRNNEVEE